MSNMPSFMNMPTSNGASGKGFKCDVVVEVKAYHLSYGVIEVKEVDTGREYFVAISKYADQRYTAQAEWEGNHIDKRMMTNNPVGSRIALEGLTDYGDESGKTMENPLSINRVIALPVNPSKTIEGIMTLRGMKDKAFDVQVWNPKAVDNLDTLKNAFDGTVAHYIQGVEHHAKTGEYLARKGVPGIQFRAVQDGVVVELSPAVQDHSLSKDAKDKRLPLSFAEIKDAAAFFRDHFQNRFPGCTVEAAVYTSFPASQNLTYPESSPLATMAKTKGKLAQDQDYPAYGGATLAVEGVLKLSPGKLNTKTGERRGEENDWADSLMVSGKKFHVHEAITSVDGMKPVISEGLAMQYPRRPGESAEQAATQSQSASAAAPAASVPAAPLPSKEFEDQSPPPAYTDDAMDLDAALNAAQSMFKSASSGPGM